MAGGRRQRAQAAEQRRRRATPARRRRLGASAGTQQAAQRQRHARAAAAGLRGGSGGASGERQRHKRQSGRRPSGMRGRRRPACRRPKGVSTHHRCRSMDSDACSEGDCFDISGPAHLMWKSDDGSSQIIPIDWGNKEHCRCIAACLVNATYIMEQERTTTGCMALAPAWWKSFHFSLRAELNDEDDDTFGAIFEHEPPRSCHPSSSAPRYVVAFRGTTNPGDLSYDWKIVANSLPDTKSFQRAHQEVAELLVDAADGPGSSCTAVWLTGHSLGASLALELGRAMMSEHGLNLPTILFNPPQVSWKPVLNMLPLQEETKEKLTVVADVTKAVAAFFLTTKSDTEQTEELSERLSPWMPELYVHEEDPICQGFINYFERRQTVEGISDLLAAATQSFSFRSMLSSAVLGKEKKQPQLLPSATLWRTKSEPSDLLRAHGIKQWWKQDAELKLISRQYSCP